MAWILVIENLDVVRVGNRTPGSAAPREVPGGRAASSDPANRSRNVAVVDGWIIRERYDRRVIKINSLDSKTDGKQ